jgi:RimJ/RimL family protein N-acetyltransferase
MAARRTSGRRSAIAMDLTTTRLHLIPVDAEFVQAVVDRDHTRAGELFQLTVPPTWPGHRAAIERLALHLAALRADPRELAWRIRLVVLKDDRVAIGSVNLEGPPRDGCVEIGWWLLASMRGMGFAREAAAAVIDWLQAQPEVHRIIATMDDDNLASVRIATHLGMRKTAQRQRELPVYELTDWR